MDKKPEFSKALIIVVTAVVLLITLSGIALAYIAVFNDYNGALPYLTALVAPAWTAYGVNIQQYYSKAKAENVIKIGQSNPHQDSD